MNENPRIALLKEIFVAFGERGDVTPLLEAVTEDVSYSSRSGAIGSSA